MSNLNSFLRRPIFSLLSMMLVFSGIVVLVAQPVWWGTSHSSDPDKPGNLDLPSVTNGNEANNNGPANIGQAKHMARSALLEMRKMGFSDLADSIEGDLVGEGANKPIKSWNLAVGSEQQEMQKTPLLIGQLKAIARPFYDHLNEASSEWVLEQLQANHADAAILNTDYWQIVDNPYHPDGYLPWNPSASSDSNKSIANIGQLKAVFSLRFETLKSSGLDSDGDGLADSWEFLHFTNLEQTANGDPDGDGISNWQEFSLNTDPKEVGSDTNSNGIPDDWEKIHAGRFAVYPPFIRAELSEGNSQNSSFKLWNDTDFQISGVISVEDDETETSGTFNYEDSITGSLPYAWEEISQTGIRLEVLQNGQLEEVIPGGFEFPFGNATVHGVFVHVDGYLKLVAEGTDDATWMSSNDLTQLARILAFNEAFEIGEGGGIYYKMEANRLIVQFEKMVSIYDSEPDSYTFQVILFSSGKIEYRYKKLGDELAVHAQKGIISGDPNLSLGLDMNEFIPKSESSVRITPTAMVKFFTLDVDSFEIPANAQIDITGSFSARGYAEGWHLNMIEISCNDSLNPDLKLEARMKVLIDTDGDGLSDAQELVIGSSIYLKDTDGDGIDDATAYASGKNPAGADVDRDGVPDSAIYSVEIEVREENQYLRFGGGFKALSGTDNIHRYLVSTRIEEYTVTGSGRYGEVKNGKQRWTSSYLNNGVLVEGIPPEVESGTSLHTWKKFNTVPQIEGETYTDSISTTTVSAPMTTGTETYITRVDSTDWEITRPGKDGEILTVNRGTEIITLVERSVLSIPITYQELWTNYARKTPWEDRLSPTVFGPLNWSHYNRNISGEARAAEYVRARFLHTDFEVGGTLSMPGSHHDDYGGDTRLKSLRWRWVRFDPFNPFDLQSVAPPAGYRQAVHLLVAQADLLRERDAQKGGILLSEAHTKGVVSIDCAAEAGPGWHEVDLEKFAAYKLGQPACHQDIDFSRYGYSQVTFGKLLMEVAVDGDRNGEITFDGKDKTTENRPYRFWINNDQDDVEADEPVLVDENKHDCLDNTIKTKRDLEDFARIRLAVGLPLEDLRQGRWKVGLKFRNTGGLHSVIRIWPNESDMGDDAYLKDETAAGRQVSKQTFGETYYGTVFIPSSYWKNRNDTEAHLIFEGQKRGANELILVLKEEGMPAEIESAFLHLKLLDVREMYRRARIANEPEDISHPWLNHNPPAQKWVWDPWNWPYSEDPEASEKTAIFVHGWRLKYMDYLNWSDSSYKRLWHQGFTGKFYSFRWPTFSGDNNRLPYGLDENLEEISDGNRLVIPPGGLTYNASEYRAWLCGPALADFVNQLSDPGPRSLFAHSMGNVVVGAALRSGMLIDRYVMCNAAVASMTYDLTRTHEECSGYRTPDTDRDPAIRDGYGLADKFKFAGLPKVEIFNFCLPNDEALKSWRLNNLLFKADHHNFYWYQEYPEPMTSHRLFYNPFRNNFRNVTRLPEAMGYVTQSRSLPAGADLNTAGSVTNAPTDMTSWGFGKTHSAVWRWSNQRSHMFWKNLAQKLKLNSPE